MTASPTRRSLKRPALVWCKSLLPVLFEQNPERQTVSNLNSLDRPGAEVCKSFKQIEVLALQQEIGCFQLRSSFVVRATEFYVFHNPGGRFEDGLPIADHQVFDPPKICPL